MEYKGPQLQAPVSGTPPVDYDKRSPGRKAASKRVSSTFTQNLSSLFGFRRKSPSTDRDTLHRAAKDNLEFTKVDVDSLNRMIQGKAMKVLNKPLSQKLEELFDAWLTDTSDTYQTLLDRQKLIAELDFAVTNDPFLSYVVEMYGHEATQIDLQNTLIQVDCADLRMKKRMGELLEEWGVTQNRVYAVITNLAQYGDAFWAHKIDPKKGIRRIIPISVRQISERLEFDPVEVSAKLASKETFMSMISKDQKLQTLLDTMDTTVSNEFADLFDKKLFGFVTQGDVVAPPWSVTHFRLGVDHSEFAPFGKSLILRSLAPFRQCNATMTLQALARVMSFPITVYEVATTPGMDENQVFEKVNEVREMYDNIGESGGNAEGYSVNTKLWVPKDLVNVTVHSPNIDLNAIGDIEMLQDRVAIASGIPKGYLIQEWGGYGNSAISLVEQFKPFARRVYTLQAAFLEGLSNLFRLHFAITGEFDYREPFVLSMKFPNEESSAERMQAKEANLSLSTKVIDAISGIVASLGDPLSPEIIQDILTKYSFLDSRDIKKWIKPVEAPPDDSKEEDMANGGGGLDVGGGSVGGGGGVSPTPDFGADVNADFADAIPDEEGASPEESGDFKNLSPEDVGDKEALDGMDMDFSTPEEAGKEEEPAPEETQDKGDFEKLPDSHKIPGKRMQELTKRYFSMKEEIYQQVMELVSKELDEMTVNNRHYVNAPIDENSEILFKTMVKIREKAYPSADRFQEVLDTFGLRRMEEGSSTWDAMKKPLDEEAVAEEDLKIRSLLHEDRETK